MKNPAPVLASFLAFVLTSGTAPSAQAREGTLELPEYIGDLEFDGEYVFKDPRLGRSYLYGAPWLSLVIYVYDDGVEHIPDGANSDVVYAQFERAIREIRSQPVYENVELLSEGSVQLGSGSSALDAREAVFTLRTEGGEAKSYLWITGYGGLIYKVRFPASHIREQDGRINRGEILEAVGESIRRAHEARPIRQASNLTDSPVGS